METGKKIAMAILGPTAVGKSHIALEVAKKIGGEILSCDSMQIYRGMDVGTAKPSLQEQKEVPHHMIDVVDPKTPYSVAMYQKEAKKKMAAILERNRMPLVSGGTGLYFHSLLYDMDFAAPPQNERYRQHLYAMEKEKGSGFLHDRLNQKDPFAARRIHPHNTKRIVRALENLQTTGEATPSMEKIQSLSPDYQWLLFGLRRDREELYERINNRVDVLMKRGLKEEVASLLNQGCRATDMAMKGIGYKELVDHLEGRCALDEAVETVKKNTRHYAKRQMTWLKRYEDIQWFDLSTSSEEQVIEDIVAWVQKNK